MTFLARASFLFCYYYGMYTIENKGNGIHHVNLFIWHCSLLYFINCTSFAIPVLTHCSEVVQHTTSHACLPIGWTLLRWLPGSTVFAFLLGWCLYSCFSGVAYSAFDYSFCELTTWNYLLYFKLSSIAFWVLWAPTLLSPPNTHYWNNVHHYCKIVCDFHNHAIIVQPDNQLLL